MFIYTRTLIHSHTHTCLPSYSHTLMYSHTESYSHASIRILTHTKAYTRIHTHTHTHAYTHLHAYTCALPLFLFRRIQRLPWPHGGAQGGGTIHSGQGRVPKVNTCVYMETKGVKARVERIGRSDVMRWWGCFVHLQINIIAVFHTYIIL